MVLAYYGSFLLLNIIFLAPDCGSGALGIGASLEMAETSLVGTVWRQGGGLTTSLRSDWATPRAIFEMLDREFHFALDVCAKRETAQCTEFFADGGLERLWVPVDDGSVWCNPPYGKTIGDWVEKAWRETCKPHRGIVIVLLLPARTDTSWFHNYLLNKAEIRFIRGRLCFDDNPRKRAPFPSMIAILRGAPGYR